MSYSVCLKCVKQVSQFEKYCEECAKEYRQDKDFWRTVRANPFFGFAGPGFDRAVVDRELEGDKLKERGDG